MLKNQTGSAYQNIYQKVLHLHRRRIFFVILSHLIKYLTLVLSIILVFLGINLLFDVNQILRFIFLFSVILGSIFLFILRIYPSLQEIFSPSLPQLYQTTNLYGINDADIKDLLTNYLQIHRDESERGSSILKIRALNQLSAKLSPVVQNIRPMPANMGYGFYTVLASFSIFATLYIFFPVQMAISLGKIFIPWQNFKEQLPTSLINSSGNISVLKNDPITLFGSYQGLKPENIFIVIEDSTAKPVSDRKEDQNRLQLSLQANNLFSYEMDHVRNSFKYYFVGNLNHPRFRDLVATSEKGTVTVKERPMVRGLQIKITPPSYTGLSPQLLSPDEGNISALKGSTIQIHIESNRQLSRAQIIFSNSTNRELTVKGHIAEGSFQLSKTQNYHIKIQDNERLSNFDPVEYNIFILPDEYPFAEFRVPGTDIDLEDQLITPILVEYRDDFGFTKARLKGEVIRAASSGDTTAFEIKLPIKMIDKGKAFSEFKWDLTSFYLIPDDYIDYYAEIWDNDRVSGPKSYVTKKYTIRLPSILEILAKGDQNQEENIQDIKEISKNSSEIKKKIEEINRELQKETKLDWENKQEIEKQLKKQDEVIKKLAEVQKKVQDFVENFDQKNLLSPETVEKYMELQKMLQDLATPELKNAMQKLQEAMKRADLKQVQQALEEMQFSMEQFEKNIERTYELFKRVQLEQKFDEIIKMAEKLTEDQKLVNEKLRESNLDEQTFKNLANQENEIQQNEKYLEEAIKNTQKDYNELMNKSSEMLDKAQTFMQDQQMNENIQQMMSQLMNSQQSSASQSGQNLQSQMQFLQNMLSMASQNMTNQQQLEISEEMQKSIQDMLSTSFEQEEILNQTQKLNSASPRINESALKQSQLQENTRQLIGQLIELSKKTFFISPQLNKTMENVMSNMQNSINHLENRNASQATNEQRRAMASFNSALLSLQNSQNQLSQASSASGFQEFMQQLQQMAGQQGQLNQESLSLFQNSQGGKLELSPDALARLAAQQEMIRKSLENMTGKMGERRDVLGRLNELGGEMDEVINELKAKNIDRKVIERQERILSRMLDAQKSIREKEYSRKRKAEYEKQQLAKSPPELQIDLIQKEDRLRRELLEALEEGYSPEYKELIKKYFESLYKESSPQF